jgi:aminomethyltransferase
MTEPRRLFHLALRDVHRAAGATFETRGEWSLPGHYGDPAAEHTAIREAAAILDRSHRSRFMVTGTDAHVVLGRVFAGHVDELEEGRAMRTVALDSRGLISDLVLIGRTGGIAYLVSGEPGQRAGTRSRIEDAADPGFDVRIDDRTETTCQLALTGPSAAEVAREHLSDALPRRLQPLHCLAFELHGFRSLVTRASDTGEDGFEFVLAPAVAQHVIAVLRAAGVPFAGHLAQEVARVETCIPAFAPDIETGLTPAEADLDVLLDVPGGMQARILSAILVDGDPVPSGTALKSDGLVVGEVRSCLRAFTPAAAVGLAIVDAQHALPGATLDADGIPCTIVAKPFYRRRS